MRTQIFIDSVEAPECANQDQRETENETEVNKKFKSCDGAAEKLIKWLNPAWEAFARA